MIDIRRPLRKPMSGEGTSRLALKTTEKVALIEPTIPSHIVISGLWWNDEFGGNRAFLKLAGHPHLIT